MKYLLWLDASKKIVVAHFLLFNLLNFFYEVCSLRDFSKILSEKILEFLSNVDLKKSCIILTAVFFYLLGFYFVFL